jgi:uncharacterized protein YbjT (DUF2867 family)
VWFAIGVVAWCVASYEDRKFTGFAVAGAIALFLVSQTAGNSPEFWSPYYRLNVTERALPKGHQVE